MAVVPSASLLLCLSGLQSTLSTWTSSTYKFPDSKVTVHDLATLDVRTVVEKSAGATALRLEATPFSDNSRLCVFVKRKLLFYEFSNDCFRFIQELPLQDKVLTIEWCYGHVCATLTNAYVIIDAATVTVTNIISTKRGAAACALPTHQWALLKEGTL